MSDNQMITRTLTILTMLALTAGEARADAAAAAPPTKDTAVIQFVGLVPGSGQAILWDAGHKMYRVVKAGDKIRSAKVESVSAEGVLITHGSIKVVVPLAPSPFLLRRHAEKKKASGPPAVIIAPRRYQDQPPFIGDQPAQPAPEKKEPTAAPASPSPTAEEAAPAAEATQAAPAQVEVEQPPPLPTAKINS